MEKYLEGFSSKRLPFSPQRYFGGRKEDIYQPYVSSYFYTIFNLPSRIFTENKQELEKILISTCVSATIPERTINYGEVPGFGGTKIYIATNQAISNTIDFSFKETTDLPVWNIIEKWAGLIVPHFGASVFDSQIQNDYKGEVTVVMCKPTKITGAYELSDIDSCYHFEGIFPTSSPGSQLDITNGEGQSQNMTFSFDGWPKMSNSFGLEKLNAYGIAPNVIEHRIFQI